MDESLTNCPMCGTVNEASGLLGARIHYCCRSCGWWYDAINDCYEESDDDTTTDA